MTYRYNAIQTAATAYTAIRENHPTMIHLDFGFG
jgi:hypothetical protein